MWSLFSDFFETVFNLDNRLFRTLRDLVIPGELSIKYLAGKQRPFFQPLRLFFVSTVLMLSAYAIFTADRVGESFDTSIEEARAGAYQRLFEANLRAELDTMAMEMADPEATTLLETIEEQHLNSSPDSLTLGLLDVDEDNVEGVQLKVSEADFYTLSSRELLEKYEVEGWLAQYEAKQLHAIMRSGSRAIAGMMGQLIWGIVFIIPLAALMLKIIYIRRKRTYVEHLVFSLHVHAFLFLLQALAAIVFYWFDTPAFLWATIPLTIIYFVVALKRVYRQGWGKTLIKTWLLFLGYTMILSTAFGIGVLGALMLY